MKSKEGFWAWSQVISRVDANITPLILNTMVEKNPCEILICIYKSRCILGGHFKTRSRTSRYRGYANVALNLCAFMLLCNLSDINCTTQSFLSAFDILAGIISFSEPINNRRILIILQNVIAILHDEKKISAYFNLRQQRDLYIYILTVVNSNKEKRKEIKP